MNHAKYYLLCGSCKPPKYFVMDSKVRKGLSSNVAHCPHCLLALGMIDFNSVQANNAQPEAITDPITNPEMYR